MEATQKITFSDKAFNNGVGFGGLIMFLINMGISSFVAIKLADYLHSPDSLRTGLVIAFVVFYGAYTVARMNNYEQRASAKKKMQSLEMELQTLLPEKQSLSDSMQSLEIEKQTLLKKVRTLEANERTLRDRAIDLEQSLKSEEAGAEKRIADAVANAEAVAKQKYSPIIIEAQNLQKQAIDSAKHWKASYEALSREVDKANAEKEVQSLRKSILARESAMTGRVWNSEALAKHEAEKQRLATLESL